MEVLITGLVILLIFGISAVIEPRRFVNAILLLAACAFIFYGVADITSYSQIGNAVALAIAYGLIPFTMAFMAALFIVDAFVMIKKEGKSIKNLLSLFCGAAIIAGMAWIVAMVVIFPHNVFIANIMIYGSFLMFYFSFTFIALMIYSVMYTAIPKKLEVDYIIVHGCGLLDGERISPLLRGRVDKAVAVYEKAAGRAKIVLSGGQGPDEKVSEAEAMWKYLQETGFSRENVILEDKSATTYENLKNVRDMLDRDGVRHKYIFVTSNYHVFRTSIFARELKIKGAGVGSRTALYYWPSAFIREYAAVMVKFKWGTIAILVLMLLFMFVTSLPV